MIFSVLQNFNGLLLWTRSCASVLKTKNWVGISDIASLDALVIVSLLGWLLENTKFCSSKQTLAVRSLAGQQQT